jgi:hypothetical protein
MEKDDLEEFENEMFDDEIEEETEDTPEVVSGPDWESEAKKFKAIASRLKKKLEEKPVKKETKKLSEQVDVEQVLSEQNERVELRLKGYTHEEIEFMSRNRKNGQSLTEASTDPYVQAGIETVRSKTQAEQKTLSPSNKATRFNGKSFNEIISDGTPEEKQSAFESMLSKRLNNQSE